MTQRLARIVPADPDSPHVRGTKVVTADGSEIRGIRKLTLVADADKRNWVAHIEMRVLPPVGLTAEHETTDITSTEREYKAREVTGEDADAIGKAIARSALSTGSQELDRYIASMHARRESWTENTQAISDALKGILKELQRTARPPRNARS